VLKQFPVLLHCRAAASGVHDDSVDVRGEKGIDIAASDVAGGGAIAGMEVESAATALSGWSDSGHAVTRENPHSRRVRARIEVGHDAAREQRDTTAGAVWRVLGLERLRGDYRKHSLCFREAFRQEAKKARRADEPLKSAPLVEAKQPEEQAEARWMGQRLPQDPVADPPGSRQPPLLR
jgi:hypothetical protein